MRQTIACIIVSALGTSAFAAPINYGNFSGTNVHFLNVTEDSNTDPLPLFGAPTLAGDSLAFNPVSFGANASAGNGYTDITDGTLTATITAKPGKSINFITISESGDFTLAGQGFATVSVAATMFAQVVEVNGAAINPITINGTLLFTPTGDPTTAAGDYSLPTHAGVGVVWSGSGTLDIDAALAGRNVQGHATKVLFSMDNTLVAIGSETAVAFVKKKTNGVTIIVPEPATLSVLAGAAVLGLKRRR
jgi:hypothetical protein